MPMTTTLNASACPAAQLTRAAFLRMTDSPSVTNGNAPCAQNMAIGNGSNFRFDTIRPNALYLDLLSGYGGANACCILTGSNLGNELQLVAPGSGLLLTIKAGHYNAGGIVEVIADTTLAIPSVNGLYWIWGGQNATLSYTSTTTPPAGTNCCLGNCTVLTGNITAVDRSGVVYLRGSNLIRFTADPGIPTDTPPVGVLLYSVTAFGTFVWDGAAHQQLGTPEVSADPTSLANGMQWFRSDLLQPSRRTGGTTKRGVAFT
jgi:hypothetical protein